MAGKSVSPISPLSLNFVLDNGIIDVGSTNPDQLTPRTRDAFFLAENCRRAGLEKRTQQIQKFLLLG